MPLTDQFYASNTPGLNRVIQDFGLCNLKGEYFYTAKLRTKGLLVVVFFAPNSAPSVLALETVQNWAAELASPKWSAVALTEGEHDEVAAWADGRKLDGVPILLDHELYQTRRWGVSHLPTVYLVDGKSGRVLSKITGDDTAGLSATKQMLSDTIAKMVAADEAAKKAEEDKKAADAAAKAAEEAAKAAASVEKPSEPNPSQAAKS
jgi:peroxiredoxin